MLKTLSAIALTATLLAGAGAAYAQGGYYDWDTGRETYPNTVARYADNQEIFAGHGNLLAETRGKTRAGTVARNREARIFAGHPNTYHLERGGNLVAGDVSVAEK